MLPGILETVEGGLCLREVSELLEALEVMRCMLLCMLEAVEGGLCLRELSEALQVPEVMRCVLLCMLEGVEVSKFAGGDALYATLYVRGRGG